jgi:hypothetical protein
MPETFTRRLPFSRVHSLFFDATMRFEAWHLLAITLSCLPHVYKAGIMPFDLLMEPTDEFVHYNDGYIRGPGFIDLGGLQFTAISAAYVTDEMIDNESDGGGTEGDDEDEPPRRLDEGGGVDVSGSVLDIVLFRLPTSCVHSKKGCDWPALGVGNRTTEGALTWCCSREALLQGVCNKKDFGRLILDNDKFNANNGNHPFISIPSEGAVSKKLQRGKFDEIKSGAYDHFGVTLSWLTSRD